MNHLEPETLKGLGFAVWGLGFRRLGFRGLGLLGFRVSLVEYQASREAFGKFSDAGHRGHQLLCAGGLDVLGPRVSESFSSHFTCYVFPRASGGLLSGLVLSTGAPCSELT